MSCLTFTVYKTSLGKKKPITFSMQWSQVQYVWLTQNENDKSIIQLLWVMCNMHGTPDNYIFNCSRKSYKE